MTDEEQISICKQIAVTCMWGQGGIASVLLERLQEDGPAGPRPWPEVYRENAKAARRQYIGVITDEAELRRYLSRRYDICNHDEDGASLHHPPPMGGLAYYVSKELADKFKRPATTTAYHGMGVGYGKFLG